VAGITRPPARRSRACIGLRLTKRVQRLDLSGDIGAHIGVLPNVWLGISAEDQSSGGNRRFCSYTPSSLVPGYDGGDCAVSTFFSDYFSVDPAVIETYGAFNISLITDLPLFIDPFLLFNSTHPEYRRLHGEIIKYLVFLKEKATAGDVSDALLESWYCFPEVKQTWLGFTIGSNEGAGLGMDFARTLHGSLHRLFPEFGRESVTKGSHLEKICLIKEGVGRDNISDFTTNLIKGFLYTYTERFAKNHLNTDQCRVVPVRNIQFNFETESWQSDRYTLPWANGDHIVLTPKDLLTRDENWINKKDLLRNFEDIPPAIPDPELRAQVNNYFHKMLVVPKDREPTRAERNAAALQTIQEYPHVVDYYIREKEKNGAAAESISFEKVKFSQLIFNTQIRALQDALNATAFYTVPDTTYEESHARLRYLKDVIEKQDGYRFFYKDGKPIKYEKDLQVMFRLVWFGTPSDVTSEANDGRGPADFKVSRGAKDKTIIEMKLAKNTALRRNLKHQANIYKAASGAKAAIKCIMFFSPEERDRLEALLNELDLRSCPDVVVIDARNDNKPPGSKATSS
jgi:hypothetical protein